MNINQTGELLARIQVHDNRKVDALVIEEWFHDLQDIDYADALQAVRIHRRQENAPYLNVSHVLAGVRKLRAARVEGADAIDPPTGMDPDDTRAYQAWLRSTRAAVASGQVTPPPPAKPGQIAPEVKALLGGIGKRTPRRDQ